MKEPKKGILSSFIKYLKSLIQNFKGDFEPLIRKEHNKEKRACSEIPFPRGRSKGTKESKLDQHRSEIVRALDSGETKTSIAKRLGTSQVNLHYWIKRRKIRIQKKHLLINKS